MSLASRDWNDMSSSSDQSNEDPNSAEGNTQIDALKTQNVHLPIASSTKPLQQVKQEKEEVRNNNKEKGQGDKKMQHLTDEQLLAEYVNKRVDDTKTIRVTACRHQQYKDMLNNLSNARAKQIKDGFFILYFKTEEGLLQFFREKMEKRYKFFFLPYMKRKESGEYRSKDQGRYQNRDNNGRRQKKEYVLRGQRQHDLIVKEEEKIEEKQEKVEVETQKKVGEEKLKKSTFIEREHFQIEKMMNVLHIDSSLFEVERVIKELESRRVFKDFNKIVIKTPPQAIQKVSKLCFQIGHRKKYYLDKQPQLEGPIIEMMLIENGKDSQTRQFYEHHSGQSTSAHQQKDKPITKESKKIYESKDTQQRKQHKPTRTNRYQKDEKQLREPHQREQRERKDEEQQAKRYKKTEDKEVVVQQKLQGPQGRRLGSKYNDYFQNVATNNLSTLVNGFDQNEYIKRLKDESVNIDKNWNSWKVQAEDDNIQALLKLVHRLKKSTIYNVQLLPSLRNEKAILTAELKPRPEKERRPKVDVSSVNGYLS